MNDRGPQFNEAFFAAQQTNRNYAGPLDMPWLDIGMCIMQFFDRKKDGGHGEWF
jgi:hypothetical protein